LVATLLACALTPLHALAQSPDHTDLFVMQEGELWRVDEVKANVTQITTGNAWLGVTALVPESTVGDDAGQNTSGAYAIRDGCIWHVDLSTGSEGNTRLVSDDDWGGPVQMAYGVYAANGQWVTTLTVWQNGYLYKINTRTGDYSLLGTTAWPDVPAMAYLNSNHDGDGNDLLAVVANELWRINLNTGAGVRVGTKNWYLTTAMTTDGKYLYISTPNHLYKVNPVTGNGTDVPGTWSWINTMTHFEAGTFVIDNGAMYKLVLGGKQLIGGPNWWPAPALMTYRVEGR